MIKLLLGLDAVPTPHDAADALAVAICHLHHGTGADCRPRPRASPRAEPAVRSWRGLPPDVAPMIARLRGTLVDKTPSRVVVDVGGVGYDVQVPLSTFYPLGEPARRSSLRIHTHVREDAIALFGFATALEHDLFERLIGINGVGPKLALAVLSGIEPAELIRAVRTADVARLTKIPGVGKKTAERIGLELKDRLPVATEAARPSSRRRRAEDQLRSDVLSALLNLGYQQAAAEKALDKAIAAAPDATFEQLLRAALKALMRRMSRRDAE